MKFEVKLTEIDKFYVKDMLRAVIHSILFHRSFISVGSTSDVGVAEVTTDWLLNGSFITWVKLVDKEIDKLVDDKINLLMKGLERSNSSSSSSQAHQIQIMFFVEKKNKASYWFGSAADNSNNNFNSSGDGGNSGGSWEQWIIHVHLPTRQSQSEKDQIDSKRRAGQTLLHVLMDISKKMDQEKNHIPAITQTSTSSSSLDRYPFPWQIVVNAPSDSVGWTGMLRGLMG